MALSDIFERLDRWVGYRPDSRATTAADFARGYDDDEWFESRSGESVSFDTVIGIQHVWSCVTLLVNDIRKLPVDTYRDAGAGRKEPIAKPGWMRYPDPSDQNISFRDHIGQAVLSLLVDGNAFIYAWPSVYNVEVLLVLDPQKVDIRDGRYVVHGYPTPLTDMNIRHVRNLTQPGKKRGMNPIQATREGFGLTLAAERFGQRFFSNGAVMSGLIEIPQGVQADPDQLKKQMQRNHKGADKSHALGVLTGGATFRQLSFSPEDTQFLALRKYQLEDAARMFHIPPFKIGSTEPGAVAYASTSNARIDYVDSAISPIVVLLEDVYSDLIPGDGTFMKFNLAALLRGDPVARSQALNTQAQAGVITRQEWRDFEDYGPADEAPGVGSENGGYLQTPNNTAPNAAPPEPPAPDAVRTLPAPEDDDLRALTVNVNQPDVAEALREMRAAAEDSRRVASLMEERAQRAEEHIAQLVARAPVVNVEAPVVNVAPADVTVNVPQQEAPHVRVVNEVPSVQSVRIVGLPRLDAKVNRDQQGRVTSLTEG